MTDGRAASGRLWGHITSDPTTGPTPKETTMTTTSAPSLVQQWIVVTDERGAQLLVARWVSDSRRVDAAGIA
jgi:hypothetical protein